MKHVLLLPPCGGGREGGNPGQRSKGRDTKLASGFSPPLLSGFPPPLTPPHKGEGDRRVIVTTCEVVT